MGPRAWPGRAVASPYGGIVAGQRGRAIIAGARLTICDVVARWFGAVVDAGVAAADAAGNRYGVVSIIGDVLAVVGTEDHLGRAKSLHRSGAVKRAGLNPFTPQAKGLVYVVDRDGALL